MKQGKSFELKGGESSSAVIVPFTDEEKKIHSLFLSANFLENLGITNGKMGIAVFFFCRYRQTGERLYEDFAFELLDEVDAAMNDRTLVGFRFGLCGIGWGIEYLVRERFVGVEEDICARFEHRIHHFLLYDLYQGVGLANGLCGVLLYLLTRIESSLVQPDSEIMFTNKRFIIYTLDKLSLLLDSQTIAVCLEEQDNDALGEEVPLVLSNWDYPVLLWVLGRVALHGILKEKTEILLRQLLNPLCDLQLLPTRSNNRKLLQRVLGSLLMLKACDITGLALKILPNIPGEQSRELGLNDEPLGDVSGEFLRFISGQMASSADLLPVSAG